MLQKMMLVKKSSVVHATYKRETMFFDIGQLLPSTPCPLGISNLANLSHEKLSVALGFEMSS